MSYISDSWQDQWYIDRCTSHAIFSSCTRSRCGSVIVHGAGEIIGTGYNSQPQGTCIECFKDTLPANFKSDKTCCVHAEQRAIMDALKRNSHLLRGSTLYFARIDANSKILKAGKPYCTICSKMALDVGIAKFVLFHEEGITVYDTKEYNDLSFQYIP